MNGNHHEADVDVATGSLMLDILAHREWFGRLHSERDRLAVRLLIAACIQELKGEPLCITDAAMYMGTHHGRAVTNNVERVVGLGLLSGERGQDRRKVYLRPTLETMRLFHQDMRQCIIDMQTVVDMAQRKGG